MTQDVRQWLSEIKNLQKQLEELQQERNQAYASAANWRDLYQEEAKQRRTDANLARQQIELLQAEIQKLQDRRGATAYSDSTLASIQQEVMSLSISQLQERLIQSLIECDRLAQSLMAEKASHAQTRNDLTTALGDAVDSLSKERLQVAPGNPPSSSDATSAQSKTPLPELPPLS